jgi:hypothetical protein
MTIQWINATINNQTSLFSCMCQLQVANLELQIQVKEVLPGMERSLTERLSLNLIPPDVLLPILKMSPFVFQMDIVYLQD